MKKLFVIAAVVLASLPVAAQETYENAKIAATDLNGTARYVGMGGAMEALGADISTISSNPAGIGLFRKGQVSASFGFVSQSGASPVVGGSTTNASFDQVGIVLSSRTGKESWLNFGFNFHKSRNFDFILSVTDRLVNASQNKLTYAKAKNGLLYKVNKDGSPDFNSPYVTGNQLDDIYSYNLNYDPSVNTWYYADGLERNDAYYQYDRSHEGYIGEYDFNISGNINNRVYLGLTVGIHDVHYKHYGEYTEYNLQDAGGLFNMRVADERRIKGTGVSVKAGVIVRPIEESPFRFGVYVSSPTFYKLTTSNFTELSDGTNHHNSREIIDSRQRTSYEFKLNTPWVFGFSLGHTIGSSVALGATVEYTDYGAMDTRYITGTYYNYWTDTYTKESASDDVMNRHTKETLKGVATVKLGVEYKPVPELGLRMGYNYVSPMYKLEGFKDGTLNSDASYVSSATDYTNWQATHRLTFGIGYSIGKFNIAAAYQFSTTSGEFHPFMNYEDYNEPVDDCIARHVDVKHKRHQVLCTLSYSF